MQDITEQMERFRESCRHLWNVAFLPLVGAAREDGLRSESDYDLQDRFSNIAVDIFAAIVLCPHGLYAAHMATDHDNVREPLDFLQIVPNGLGLEILVNRTSPPCGYWDDPVRIVMRGEATLYLIRYFDFGQFTHRDFEYYRVRIAAFPNHPHLVGRDALVRAKSSRVLRDDKGGV